MRDDLCGEMQLLIQADFDGELSPAEAARTADHVRRCADCREIEASLLQLSQRLKTEAPRYEASAALRASTRAALARARTTTPAGRPWRDRGAARVGRAAWFGGGFAIAAALALAVLPAAGTLPDEIVASHVRALQPGHLMDVVSTDQHTVKPWFDGRLPFAPPVKDLAADGFPLAGGRLDYVPGHTAATLVYKRRQHLIDLFAWPSAAGNDLQPASGSRDGYNYRRWQDAGMTFWAVSDLDATDLATFVRAWQAR